MRTTLCLTGLALLFLPLIGCAAPNPPATVQTLDLDRYAGRWYEIARYPNRFQRDLVAVTADYDLRDDGRITVTNQGRVKTLDGKLKSITGKARVPDADEPAKLEVQFFWPFWGDY